MVAKAFKTLGILKDDNKACSSFYPHHFSARGDSILSLTIGTTIEPEMEIILDDKITEADYILDKIGNEDNLFGK